eukprot:TRINITY_DN996_c0_g1_i5.p1 TRINITY_DN996_c0_g1~~TRINITY_DN996_c0_g1_i5.p1  ORF type:complete len:106 (+),score=22.35 TRINITY_DN996_c0_g1_i5:150-467(+)
MCIRDSSYSGRVFQYSVFVYYKSMTTNECMYSRMKLERCDPDVRSLDSHRYNVIVVTSTIDSTNTVSYTHLRAHETPEHLVCRLLLEKKKKKKKKKDNRDITLDK